MDAYLSSFVDTADIASSSSAEIAESELSIGENTAAAAARVQREVPTPSVQREVPTQSPVCRGQKATSCPIFTSLSKYWCHTDPVGPMGPLLFWAFLGTRALWAHTRPYAPISAPTMLSNDGWPVRPPVHP